MASGRLTSWQIDGETVERVTDFMFWSSQITTNGDCSHEIKMLAPWKKSYDQPHASKVMLIILQARLQQYMNCELPDVQAGFRKGRGTRDHIATFTGSWKKQESSRKTSISALLTMPKPLTVWITINCGKF